MSGRRQPLSTLRKTSRTISQQQRRLNTIIFKNFHFTCAVILFPALILFHYRLGAEINNNDTTNQLLTSQSQTSKAFKKNQESQLSGSHILKGKTTTIATIDSNFAAMLKSLNEPFDFLETTLLPGVSSRPLQSDVVELRHCDLSSIDYHNYTTWASFILNDAWPGFHRKLKSNNPEVRDFNVDYWKKMMIPEFSLGLLEIYATHNNHCDFSKFPLRIEYDLTSEEAAIRKVPPSSEEDLPRLAIVIVAFKDPQHLKRLVQAIHMPHHYIIIHLERLTPPSYVELVHDIAANFDNVVVVQFGTVTYRTDSVSFINYQIMNWLVNDLALEYDYHLTMGGAVYPLYSAKGLTMHLQQLKTTKKKRRDVWLGEIAFQGKIMAGDESSSQIGYLQRKRLIFTSGNIRKYQQRTKKYEQNGFVPKIPDFIRGNMTTKTNSGNQAIFSYHFVKKLTKSPEVKELFATAKYGCCCCLEERTWITAASMIGYREEALEAASMFQVWGGKIDCQSSMGNAILSTNASICFRNEDGTVGSAYHDRERNSQEVIGGDGAVYFRGNETMSMLRNAKSRGFMFVRKFNSNDADSVALLDLIEKEFHKDS